MCKQTIQPDQFVAGVVFAGVVAAGVVAAPAVGDGDFLAGSPQPTVKAVRLQSMPMRTMMEDSFFT